MPIAHSKILRAVTIETLAWKLQGMVLIDVAKEMKRMMVMIRIIDALRATVGAGRKRS